MGQARIAIAAGDYRLTAAPGRGGSILALTWREQQVLREAAGADVLDVGCFPLVPWSNRIAGGRFDWNGRAITLSPNFPTVDPRNPLHGFGWLSEWTVTEAVADLLRMEHVCPGGEWPWAYRAELVYALGDAGLTSRLALTNLAAEPMPAGLGFHPYFPRSAETCYLGLHRGEWESGTDGLPIRLDERERAIDWWNGKAVGARAVDTVYTGRECALLLCWPDRGLALRIDCSDNLSCTSVYVPEGADWFCVEPVSHITDAVNRARDRAGDKDGMVVLQAGETMVAELRWQASEIDRESSDTED